MAVIVSVVSINPQKSQSICILSWFIMKITYKQFSTLKTLMAPLHLLRPLALFKRNASLQLITKYNLCKINVDRSERKKSMKNHRQKQDYEAMEPSKKDIFLEKKQVRDMTNTKHELKRKQLKYKAMDTTKKQDMLNKKAEQYKTMDTAKKQDLLKKKVEQHKRMDTAKKQDLFRAKQNNGHC